jgi:hypothetical protein
LWYFKISTCDIEKFSLPKILNNLTNTVVKKSPRYITVQGNDSVQEGEKADNRWSDQEVGVEPEPSKVERDLHPEVIANRIQRLIRN